MPLSIRSLCKKWEDITNVLFLISSSDCLWIVQNFNMNQFIAIHRPVQAIALHHLATAQSLRLIGDQTYSDLFPGVFS